MPPDLRSKLINTVDDSAPLDDITRNALGEWAKLFPSGGWRQGSESSSEEEEEDPLESVKHDYAWTGIIGMTPDAVPFIGPIPGKKGQYVAAGYNGHGMARIFLCAPALARYMLMGDWDPDMPEAFRVTPERLGRLRVKVGLASAAGGDGKAQGEEATGEGLTKLIG